MNLHHIRYFVKLAHLEHYTKAANDLMITQPTLSQAVSIIEEELGVHLFEKEGRNVVLTKDGKLFLDYAEQSTNILDKGINKLKRISSGEGRIDFAFLRTLGVDFVPKVAKNFTNLHHDKKIDFFFYTGVSGDIIEGIKEKKYDLGICSKLEREPSIEYIPIAKQDMVVIVPKSHPLAEKECIDLRETLPYPQLAFSKTSGLRHVVDRLFEKIGETYNIAYEIEEDQVIAGLVEKDFGIAVIPNMSILQLMDVKVLPITYPSIERNFYLAYLKNKYLSPVVANFKDYILQHAEV